MKVAKINLLQLACKKENLANLGSEVRPANKTRELYKRLDLVMPRRTLRRRWKTQEGKKCRGHEWLC